MKKRELIIKSDYALVPLTQGKFAIIDLEDVDKIKNYTWQALKWKNKRYYAVTTKRKNNKRWMILMHRFIMNAPNNLQVDHINYNETLNNKKSNLRLCTNTQNNFNKPPMKGCKSKYKGVVYRKNLWMASIQINGKKVYLGTYDSEIKAALAYDNIAKKHIGEFAYLNFP